MSENKTNKNAKKTTSNAKKTTSKSNQPAKKTTAKKVVKQPKKETTNKETVKVRKETKKNFWSNSSEATKLVTVFLIVVAVFALFYVITSVIKSNTNPRDNKDEGVAVIQYDEILVGEVLNQNRDSYYVLVTEEDDNDLSLYISYVGSYTAIEDSEKVYTVNLSSVFNKNYLDETSNFDFDDLKDIKFKGATLLRVENNEITSYYEGKEDIVNFLKDLIA